MQSKVSLFVNLPLAYQQKMAAVPDVEAICKWQWFGGRFEQANGGTLVLDEVGDLELSIQGKLLGALEEGRCYRVGGRTLYTFDVRVIATSNQDLEAKIRQGSFREDLFYRLSAVPLAVPSLRQHREDIPDMIRY